MKRASLSLLPSVVAMLVVGAMLAHMQAANGGLARHSPASRPPASFVVDPSCEGFGSAGTDAADRCL